MLEILVANVEIATKNDDDDYDYDYRYIVAVVVVVPVWPMAELIIFDFLGVLVLPLLFFGCSVQLHILVAVVPIPMHWEVATTVLVADDPLDLEQSL